MIENVKEIAKVLASGDYTSLPDLVINMEKKVKYARMNLPIVELDNGDYRLVITDASNRNEFIKFISKHDYIKTLDRDLSVVYELKTCIHDVMFSGEDYLTDSIESRIKEGLTFINSIEESNLSSDEIVSLLFGVDLKYGKFHHTSVYDLLLDKSKQLKSYDSLEDSKKKSPIINNSNSF